MESHQNPILLHLDLELLASRIMKKIFLFYIEVKVKIKKNKPPSAWYSVMGVWADYSSALEILVGENAWAIKPPVLISEKSL